MKPLHIESFQKFYSYEFEPGYFFRGHAHPQWEINLVLDGRMSITYEESVLVLEAGDLFVGSPWGFHCNKLLGDRAAMVVVQFFTEEADCAVGHCVKKLTAEELAVAKLMTEEFRKLCGEKDEDIPRNPGDFFQCRRLCEVLLARTAESRQNGVPFRSEHTEIYREAVRYMEVHLGEKLGIETISAALHVSSATLKNVFSELTGRGVMTYFRTLKIRRARELLDQGSTVSFVSDTLGYSSPCYFSSSFSKAVGQSPKQYQTRKQ